MDDARLLQNDFDPMLFSDLPNGLKEQLGPVEPNRKNLDHREKEAHRTNLYTITKKSSVNTWHTI